MKAMQQMQGWYLSPGLRGPLAVSDEAGPLVKDYCWGHSCRSQIYLIIVEEGQKNFESLIQYLTYAFKSEETDSSLIAELFSQSQ